MKTELSVQIPVKRFKKALLACLDETFSNVRGIYLDKDTAYHLGGIRLALGAIRGKHA